MKRIMALDVGERRIGVAVSDLGRTLASPAGVVERKSLVEDIAAVLDLMRRWDVERVVVGYPLVMKGEAGFQAELVEEFVNSLKKALQEASLEISVVLRDERLSTACAERLLMEAGYNGRKRRTRIDAAAAAVILQDYLDSLRCEGS